MLVQVKRQALVPYSSQQMFDLVMDVRMYPDFLPWCEKGELLEESDSHQLARLHLQKAGMRHSFTTHNELIAPEVIRMNLVEGPFKSLAGEWVFLPLANTACKVTLALQFEPKGALAGAAFGSVFTQVANTMVDLFYKRAQSLYVRQ